MLAMWSTQSILEVIGCSVSDGVGVEMLIPILEARVRDIVLMIRKIGAVIMSCMILWKPVLRMWLMMLIGLEWFRSIHLHRKALMTMTTIHEQILALLMALIVHDQYNLASVAEYSIGQVRLFLVLYLLSLVR